MSEGTLQLPLYIDGLDHVPGNGGLAYASVRDATGFEVAQVRHFLIAEHKAYANIIVTAVNAYATLREQNERLKEREKNLADAAMLIRRLLHFSSAEPLCSQARDWLTRKGLNGSVLRDGGLQ